MHWVTFDQGNNSLKWCVWEAGPQDRAEIQRRGRCASGEVQTGLAELGKLIAGSVVESAFYCGVTGSESASEVRAIWETISGGAAWEEPRETMAVECEEPERVGRDRRLAAEGAYALVGASIVVDAGTALTVDAVGRGPVFLGGAIAAGPSVLAQALGSAGAQLHAVEPSPGVRALGRSTSEALEAGISIGFAGAAARLVEEVAREADLSGAPVVVTGGARSHLDREDLFCERAVHVFPDLVHLGLMTAAGRMAGLQEESWRSTSGS